MDDDQKKEYLDFAKSLAYEAGNIMRRHFLTTETTWKTDKTPLTQADTEINDLVVKRINEIYPSHSVLGEEKSDVKDSTYTWVCDPVDGTMPYSHGLPISTFSLALCENGAPEVGVAYDPFMNRLFYASTGNGAFCNEDKLTVNKNVLEHALLYLGAFPSKNGLLDVEYNMQKYVQAAGGNVMDIWSTVLPSCLVASGHFEAAILNLPYPHDAAAVKVIVEEAGGKVTDLFGNDQRYDGPTKGYIASNGVIHDELVQMIKESTR